MGDGSFCRLAAGSAGKVGPGAGLAPPGEEAQPATRATRQYPSADFAALVINRLVDIAAFDLW